MKDKSNELGVIQAIDYLVNKCHGTAVEKGFWPVNKKNRNDGEMIALMHSELSEMLEGLRGGNKQSDHIPEFSFAEEEASDLLIRLFDMAGGREWRLGEALLAKMEYNKSREHKHGKKF